MFSKLSEISFIWHKASISPAKTQNSSIFWWLSCGFKQYFRLSFFQQTASNKPNYQSLLLSHYNTFSLYQLMTRHCFNITSYVYYPYANSESPAYFNNRSPSNRKASG